MNDATRNLLMDAEGDAALLGGPDDGYPPDVFSFSVSFGGGKWAYLDVKSTVILKGDLSVYSWTWPLCWN